MSQLQTKASQGLENGGDLILAFLVGPAEAGGEGDGIGAGFGDQGADAGDLFGEFVGPGQGRGDGPDDTADLRCGEVDFGLLFDGGARGGGGILILGTQPADESALFLGGALVVEGDEAGEEFLFEGFVPRGGGEIVPAIGGEHGGVDLVVDLAEEGDEAVVVDLLFLGVQDCAGAERFEDVVDPGEGEVRMQGLLPLAVRVEPEA